jgi:AcrR family transcriptional regulator
VNNVNITARRSYHHGNLRSALVKAGLRALAHDGVAGFSLRDVARRAGVSASAVYRHFEDKEQLLAAIAAECSERLYTTIGTAMAAATDALARFRQSGIAYVQFAVENPEHFRVLTIPGLFDRLPPDARAKLDAAKAAQRADIEAGIAAGVIADIPVDEILLTAQATVHGLAHLIVEGELGEVDRERAKDLAIAATGALGCGFLPRATPFGDPMRKEIKRKR